MPRRQCVVLLFVLANVLAQSWVEREGASTLDSSITGWFFSMPLPPDTYWDGRSVCSAAASDLLDGRCSTGDPTIGICCVDCTDGLPAIPSTNNSPGCSCPPKADTNCISWTEPMRVLNGSATPTTPITFSIPVRNPACRPIKFLLNTLAGDADLRVETANPAYTSLSPSARLGMPISPYRAFNQREIGDDVFFICSRASERVDPDASIEGATLSALNTSSSISWIFLTVTAKSLSTYRLEFSVIQSGTDFLVPVSALSNRAPITITCNSGSNPLVDCSFRVKDLANPCNIVSSNNYPDPVARFYSLAGSMETEGELPVPEGLLVSLPIRMTTDRSANIDLVPGIANITECQVEVLSLTDSIGVGLALNQTFSEIQAPPGADTCNSVVLNNFLTKWSATISSLRESIPLLGTDLSSIGWIYGALKSNSAWLACNRLAESLVSATASSELMSFNSTLCVPDSATDQMEDPCCNPITEYTDCCQPRLVRQPKISFAEAPAGAHQCESSKCSVIVGERLLSSRIAKARSPLSCREQISVSVQDPKIYADVVSVCRALLSSYERSEKICRSDSECFTSCSGFKACVPPENNTEYLMALRACLLDEIPPPLRAVFLGGRDPNVVMAQFFTVGCDQGTRRQPDPSLSTPESCAAAESCNSDPNLSFSQCQDLSAQFPNMCARCDGPICSEVSVFPGCASFPPLSTPESCFQIEGAVWRNNDCYISGISTQSNCLQPPVLSSIGQTCATMYTGARTCPSICYPFAFQWISKSSFCNCANPAPQINTQNDVRVAYEYCDFMLWNSRAQSPGLCMFAVESKECFDAISEHPNLILLTRGSTWRSQGVLTTQSSCQGTGQPNPYVCSLPCANCSDPSCGICSDNNFNGYCFFPYVPSLTSWGLRLDCKRFGAIEYPDGCMSQDLDQSGCLVAGGEWRPASMTKATCEAHTGCFEPTKFRAADGGFVSFSKKSPSTCAQCGLQTIPTQTWKAGQLLDRSKFQWVSRRWSNDTFLWRETFNVNAFNEALAAARSSYLYLATRSMLSCLTGQDQAAVAQIACDCDGSGNAACYGRSLSFNAISTEVCGLYAINLTVPGKLAIQIDRDTQFTSGCSNLVVDIIDSITFARSSASVISSAFVQSLQLRKLSVVKNSNGVLVGQLASDGYQIVLSATSNSSSIELAVVMNGEMLMCVPLQSISRQSGWTKLGAAWARPSFDANFEAVDLKIFKGARVGASSSVAGQYCFPVHESGIYALAYYLPKGESASFFDTLTADQQAALIIVIIVYVFLCAVITLAIVNFILWWLIQRRTTKFSVDTFKAAMNFALLWLASAIRWIYFLVVIVGSAQDMPTPIEIFMIELPLFFFFSVLTIIILKWLEVARKSGGKHNKPRLCSVSNLIAVVLNAVMYTLLILFVVLASIGVAEEATGKCSTEQQQQNPALSITYHVLVALICFCLGASFILLGTKVTIQLLRLGGATSQKVRFIQFTSVAGACSVAMILQAILLVVTTAVVTPSIVAIIILIIVEVIPIVLLIWTWNKPIVIGKLIASVTSITRSSASETTSSTSSQSGSTTDGSGSSSFDTASTSSVGGGLGRLWSLGTDSLDAFSVAEEE